MEEERSFATRTLSVVGLGLLAFAITILAGGIWTALLVTNLQSSPAVPWSVPAMALLLWLMWSYLGGRGWPRGTSEARRRCLRANRRSGRTYLWALVAGVLSVVALAGYWIVLFRLVKMQPNALPDVSSYPRMTCGTHDPDGLVGCAVHGGGWVSRIFPGRSRTRASRSGRCHGLILGLCFRALCSWHLVAKASGVLSCGHCVWRDGVSHQLNPSGHSAPHDR